jgi:hypothetical protein
MIPISTSDKIPAFSFPSGWPVMNLPTDRRQVRVHKSMPEWHGAVLLRFPVLARARAFTLGGSRLNGS